MPPRAPGLLTLFAAFLLVLACGLACPAQELAEITVSVPGPRNISYLPIDLIPLIGADRAEGAVLRINHTGGGGVAITQLLDLDADIAVAGFPAAMSARMHGGMLTAVAAVDDAPLFVFMVRSALAREVRRPADLRGRTVGVNTSSLSSKTTSQQLAEFILAADGVRPGEVSFVPAGQSWEDQSALLLSGAVDAVMGDEPYATRLKNAGAVFFLANLADPATAASVPGGRFLHAAAYARPESLDRNPDLAARFVAMLKRSLAYVAAHDPQETAAVLIPGDEAARRAMAEALAAYPNLYSRDGSFSRAQLRETEAFFQAATAHDPRAAGVRAEAMTDPRWAGERD